MGEVRLRSSHKFMVLEISKDKGSTSPCLSSNYCPLLINPTGIESSPQKKKMFRFEDMWFSYSRCGKIVEVAWNSCAYSDLDRDMVEPQCLWQCP